MARILSTLPLSWTSAAAMLGIVYAYGVLGGSTLDSLLLMGAFAVQDRLRLAQHLVSIMGNANANDISIWAMGLAVLIAAVAVFKPESRRQKETQSRASSSSPSTPVRWTGLGKPLLFPCTTTHTRLFPKVHSFVYSYLVVGVPVGWSGVCGGMISVASGASAQRERRREQKGWYHIDAGDYLERGNGHLGPRGKLDAYLEAQGVDSVQYPHAYFITAARFLGYHFNPISLWYLYDADKTLAAMVLEVNNTFGERRMYYLTREPAAGKGEKGAVGSSSSSSAPTSLFKQVWPKDFHVSPFNSRKGSYELLANDPLAPNMQGTGPITVTVVLRSSHGRSKVVARLLSERRKDSNSNANGATVAVHSLDPAAMSLWQKSRFLAAWWWVGFATFPRIVKQAGVLFFQKRLHVWFRPEPLAKSMGRLADATEQQLEAVFRLYLRHLVESVADDGTTSTTLLAVRYIPCGLPDAQPELILSPAAAKQVKVSTSQTNANGTTAVTNGTLKGGGATAAPVEEIEFRVLTPVFYTRFVHYAHDVEALFCELRESGTVAVTPQPAPALFSKLVLAKATPPPLLQVTSPVDFVVFKMIQKLRRRPAPIERPLTWPTSQHGAPAPSPGPSSSSSPSPSSQGTSAATAETVSSGDLRGFRLSTMDGFVLALSDENQDLRRSYRAAVLALFLADRTALGLVPLLQAQWFVLRVVLAWFAAQGLLGVLGHA